MGLPLFALVWQTICGADSCSRARASASVLLRSPYTQAWELPPEVLWDSLADESFPPGTDGELVVQCHKLATAAELEQAEKEPAI